MEIEVNISKGYFIGIIFVMLVLMGMFFVISSLGGSEIFGHSSGEIEVNFQYFCFFSYNTTKCPSGWHREGIYDGHTLRGSDFPIGGTGGAETHTHNVGGEKKGSLSNNWVGSSGATYGTSSWPPYANVLVCCKD